MASLLKEIMPDMKAHYKDRRFPGDDQDWQRALATSTTVYVGNIAFTTREEQLYEVFTKVGPVDRVIMGLNEKTKTPCGFAFVIYFTRKDAEAACAYISRTKLDNRVIRVDIDWGFVDGRQFGRGRHGGQVRDDYRDDYDAGRGGYGGRAPDAVFNDALGSAGPRVAQKRRRSAVDEPTAFATAPPHDGGDAAEVDGGAEEPPTRRVKLENGAAPAATEDRDAGGGGGEEAEGADGEAIGADAGTDAGAENGEWDAEQPEVFEED